MAEHNCACDYLGIANNNSMSSSSSNNSNSSNCSLVNTHTRVKQIKLRQTERQKCKCHNKNKKETASAYIYMCVCVCVRICKSYFSNQTKSRRPLTRTATTKRPDTKTMHSGTKADGCKSPRDAKQSTCTSLIPNFAVYLSIGYRLALH